MPFLADLRTRFAKPTARLNQPAQTDGPLILSYDGDQLSVLSGKSLISAADGSAWRQGSSGGYREIPASETGYAQAYYAVVWLQRAADIRANKISELLHQGQVVRKSSGETISDHPLKVAFERSRRVYHHDLFRQWQYWRIITGECFIEPVRGTLPGLPFLTSMFGFRVLNSLVTMPVIQRGEVLGFDYAGDDHARRYAPDELVYDYTFNPFDDHRGKSMLSAVLDDMNIQRGVLIASKQYIKNGLHSRVVFVAKNQTLSQPEMDMLLAALKEQAGGPQNAGRPLILPPALESTVLDPAPPREQRIYKQDAQQAAATTTGVPLPLIVYEQNPYQLSPEQRIGWYDNALIPEALDMAYVVDTQLLPYFDSDPDHQFVLPVDQIRANLIDPKSRAEMIQTKYHGGWLTFNQALQMEGRAPIEGGDFYLMPSGVTAVPESQIGQVAELTRPPQPMALQAVPQVPERMPAAQLPSGLSTAPAVRSIDPDVIEGEVNSDCSIIPLALDELAQWQKFHRNGTGQKRAFKSFVIHEAIADSLRTALTQAGDERNAIREAFDQARALVEVKAIQSTRLDFEGEFETLLTAARAENIDRRNFAGRLRTLLRKYGEKAFRDGLRDGGVELADSEPLSEDDRATLNLKLSEQSGYVSEFGAVLFKGDGITDQTADIKPAMWFNKSVMPVYQAGLESADRNGLYEWVYGDTEHCADCLRLNGQRHRMRHWASKGFYPQGDMLECGGFNCECRFQRVNGQARGNF